MEPYAASGDRESLSCAKQAQFEFAQVCPIELKKDIAFFQSRNSLEYQQLQDLFGHY
jgi:hypothetical protein